MFEFMLTFLNLKMLLVLLTRLCDELEYIKDVAC